MKKIAAHYMAVYPEKLDIIEVGSQKKGHLLFIGLGSDLDQNMTSNWNPDSDLMIDTLGFFLGSVISDALKEEDLNLKTVIIAYQSESSTARKFHAYLVSYTLPNRLFRDYQIQTRVPTEHLIEIE